MKLLKLSLTLATPAEPKESEELTRIAASMEGTYGKGKYCPPGKDKCLDLEDLARLMANSRESRRIARRLGAAGTRFPAHAQGFRALR